MTPAERPAEPRLPPPPATQAPSLPETVPAKPSNLKKADVPAKKVSWDGRGLRVWTDTTGKHQVMARYVATLDNGSVVRLLRPDGTYVRVAFASLSEEDRHYVLGQSAKLAAAW